MIAMWAFGGGRLVHAWVPRETGSWMFSVCGNRGVQRASLRPWHPGEEKCASCAVRVERDGTLMMKWSPPGADDLRLAWPDGDAR